MLISTISPTIQASASVETFFFQIINMIRALSFTILSLCAVSIGTSTSPATPSVFCDKPKATVCQIKKLPEAPNGAAIVLPDLSHRTELRVKEGTLKNLTQAMFGLTGGTRLRLVHMEACGLESIFVLPNFVELRLGHNQLSTIVVPTGESSFALKVADLRNNRLKNATQLAPFVLLEELYLDDNFITELSMGLFKPMENLRVLSVARNNLTQVTMPAVGSGDFMLPGLESLSLAFNQLSELRMARLQLPSLRVLLLNNNKLVELPELESFDQFHSLERLALGGNSWNCAWLAQTLQNATFEIVRDPGSQNHKNCTFENVAGVCCQFTVASGPEATELFRPEIEMAREMTTRIDARHAEYLRYGTDRVDQLVTLVRQQLDKLHELAQSGEPQFVNYEQVLSLRQSVADLSSSASQLEQSTKVIVDAERQQKRLLHFMLDMKNKLVRQAIETDAVLDQVEQGWATFDRRLEERLTQRKVVVD